MTRMDVRRRAIIEDVQPRVDGGRFPSVSAVVQQGLDLLRQQDADAEADRTALRSLLAERSAGPFVTGDDLRQRLAARRGAKAE